MLQHFLKTQYFPANIFCSNKSPEWPLPSSTDKLNADSSTCDNTKVASTTSMATSSGCNEWAKPNATKMAAETAAKGMAIVFDEF